MNKKIIATFLGLSLFAVQSGLFALDSGSLKSDLNEVIQKLVIPELKQTKIEQTKPRKKSDTETEQEKQERKKREEAIIKSAGILQQQLMQGKAAEEQVLESIYVWRDGAKNPDTGEIVPPTITPQEAELFIRVLDLQDLHEKKETIKALMVSKAQVDQKKISKQWFKKRALKILLNMYHRGLITKKEMESLKRGLGLVSVSERLCSVVSSCAKKALKVTLAVGATYYFANLISSSSKRLPGLVKTLKTGMVSVPVGKIYTPIHNNGVLIKKVIYSEPFNIGFLGKLGEIAKFIFGINESAYGALSRTASVLQ